jgi:hypothetical protein
MFYSFQKNIKFITGVVTLFLLLFFNNKGVGMENPAPSKVNLLIENRYNLYSTDHKQYISVVKIPRTRRKYGLHKTTYSLITFDETIAILNCTSYTFVTDYKKHLLLPSFSFSLLRGPPCCGISQ